MLIFIFGIFPDDKNPDVVPQENSDDEFISEEKAFDRLNQATHRIVYTPHLSTTPPSLSPTHNLSPSIAGFSPLKPHGELSLTTNPAYALYNSPQHRPTFFAASQTSPLLSTPLLTAATNSNIYTRIPTRAFTPYDSKLSPTSSSYGVTVPLLVPNNNTASNYSHIDKKS